MFLVVYLGHGIFHPGSKQFLFSSKSASGFRHVLSSQIEEATEKKGCMNLSCSTRDSKNYLYVIIVLHFHF